MIREEAAIEGGREKKKTQRERERERERERNREYSAALLCVDCREYLREKTKKKEGREKRNY